MSKRLIAPADLPKYGITIKSEQRKILEDAGKFPRRVPVTERTHGYVEDEILAYGERKIAERDEVA
jgi:predicted DNA-binding transcriptional regulator AlpA